MTKACVTYKARPEEKTIRIQVNGRLTITRSHREPVSIAYSRLVVDAIRWVARSYKSQWIYELIVPFGVMYKCQDRFPDEARTIDPIKF